MAADKLILYLSSIIKLNERDIELIDRSFKRRSVVKGEILVEYSKIARHMYFILSGFIRVYHYEKGIEITNHLASENFFVTAYNSFTTKKGSEEVVYALTDGELLQITKDDLESLYRNSHNMALFGLIMSERYLVFNNQRAKDLITLTAEERYIKLLKDEPHILQNVPLQYISSYIGVEPQTLSRIRRKAFT